MDLFKETFKFYKRKQPPPNFSNVIDFKTVTSDSDTTEKLRQEILKYEINICDEVIGGMHPSHTWNAFSMQSYPGFIFICNPFTSEGERHWIRHCLLKFPQKPNKLNLDAHGDLHERQNWWNECHRMETDISLLQKLRWVTLGYHHNWDTKVYVEEQQSPFPRDLDAMCSAVARVIGWPEFEPQAAIINYYHLDSSLGGHTDHSEFNKTAPLFSFSFGQTAVFLLGGKTRAERPIAMYLRSGDVVVMSGDCRLNFHGIPRILPPDTHKRKRQEGSGEQRKSESRQGQMEDTKTPRDEEEDIDDYMSWSRININVRQVF